MHNLQHLQQLLFGSIRHQLVAIIALVNAVVMSLLVAALGMRDQMEPAAAVLHGAGYILAAVLIGSALAYGLGSRLSRRLYRLLEVADITRSWHRTRRAPVDGSDEIARLALAFNRMLDTLAGSERGLIRLNDRLEQHLEDTWRALDKSERELAAASGEIGDLALAAAHELRVPLVNIQGFCGELRYGVKALQEELERLDGGLPAEQRNRLSIVMRDDVQESLSFIEGATAALSHRVAALLRLARAGHLQPALERVDLAALVAAQLAGLQHRLSAVGGEVVLGSLQPALADPQALEQIVASLLSNALLYRRNGVAPRIVIWSECDAAGVTLHIGDNGRGMSAADIPAAFELFQRLGAQDAPGEGVGLSYAQVLAHRHGGRIWCDSTPGAGSTFHVFLPERQLGHLYNDANERADDRPAG
jgi:signal transduction histidine kinase